MDAYSKYLSNALNKYKIHVSSYHGNAGDELIIKATFKIIKNLDNNFINASCNEADIILIPGGNFSMWQIFYNKIYDYITNYNAKLIIGPSTFHGNFTDWRNLLINNTSRFEALFPRDKISHDNLLELNLYEVYIKQVCDSAFTLRSSNLVKSLKNISESKYNLVVLRNDHESLNLINTNDIKFRNKITRKFYRSLNKRIIKKRIKKLNIKDPLVKDVVHLNFSEFCDYVAKSKCIYTDRLHVTILGLMLNKKVYILKTNYDKISNALEGNISENEEKLLYFE